jgi:hypothetical protein
MDDEELVRAAEQLKADVTEINAAVDQYARGSTHET